MISVFSIGFILGFLFAIIVFSIKARLKLSKEIDGIKSPLAAAILPRENNTEITALITAAVYEYRKKNFKD